MKHLIDSDYVIDWLLGRQPVVALLIALGQGGLAISLITFGEVYEGIYYGRDPEASESVFQRFLRNTVVVPLDEPIMRRFARIRGDLRRRGQIIGDPDILIAATAIQHDLMLVTRNLRDFQRIQGLRVYHPV